MMRAWPIKSTRTRIQVSHAQLAREQAEHQIRLTCAAQWRDTQALARELAQVSQKHFTVLGRQQQAMASALAQNAQAMGEELSAATSAALTELGACTINRPLITMHD